MKTELTNLGTALRFAISMEAAAQEILEHQARSAADPELKDFFLSLSNGNKKRKGILENLYKESLYSDQDTGIFEPIAGLTSTDYIIGQTTAREGKHPGSLVQAIETEEKAHRYYTDLAAVLKSRRRTLSMTFQAMARENSNRKEKLLALQNSQLREGTN